MKEDFSPFQLFPSSLELFFSISSDPSHYSKDVSPASLNEHLFANLQSTRKEWPQKDRPKVFNPSCSTTDVCTCAHSLVQGAAQFFWKGFGPSANENGLQLPHLFLHDNMLGIQLLANSLLMS